MDPVTSAGDRMTHNRTAAFRLSVVIPTRNRAAILSRTLAYWSAQSGDVHPWELIVVDDGSTDDTQCVLNAASHTVRPALVPIRASGAGPATARNLAIAAARAPVVLFVNDDVWPEPSVAARHLAWHEQHPSPLDCLLGLVQWSNELPLSPFLRWYTPAFQFDYSAATQGRATPSTSFFSAHVSVKRALLVENHAYFDEAFHAAAFEDLELGYRLEGLGGRLSFDSEALAFHHHPMDVHSVLKRMVMCGGWSDLYAMRTSKSPPLDRSRRAKRLVVCLWRAAFGWPARWVSQLIQHSCTAPWVFRLAIVSAIHEGLARHHFKTLFSSKSRSLHG
jgi:glycosyltransferase involved in cell wall biosynthesis